MEAAQALTPTATSDVAERTFCGNAVNSRQIGMLTMPPPTPTSGPMQPLNVPSKPSKNICFLGTGSGLFELKAAYFNLGELQAA
jgi:hypothetical protein